MRPTPALQCTVMGPASSGRVAQWACTLRTNINIVVVTLGTPWSGHDVKWNWVTVNSFTLPSCNKYNQFITLFIFQEILCLFYKKFINKKIPCLVWKCGCCSRQNWWTLLVSLAPHQMSQHLPSPVASNSGIWSCRPPPVLSTSRSHYCAAPISCARSLLRCSAVDLFTQHTDTIPHTFHIKLYLVTTQSYIYNGVFFLKFFVVYFAYAQRWHHN